MVTDSSSRNGRWEGKYTINGYRPEKTKTEVIIGNLEQCTESNGHRLEQSIMEGMIGSLGKAKKELLPFGR